MNAAELDYRFTTTALPIQAEGTVRGRPFYFHARHQSWTFSVSDTPSLDPVDIESAVDGFFLEGEYSGGRLPLNEAAAIIGRCAGVYLNRA